MKNMKDISNQRAQISSEFVIILSVMLIIFVSLVFLAMRNATLAYAEYDAQDADYLASLLRLHLNNVLLAGDGTTIAVLLPSVIGRNTPYTITVYPASRILVIAYGTHHSSSSISSSSISGTLSFVGGDTITIANQKETIVLTKA